MTERPLSITTQVATPIQTTFNSAASNTANDALLVTESMDEEPYTIKCICDYPDDDGNTIYCETCDTWQHIECFYPGRVADASREEFDHSCADCKPRPLDRRHATERQRHHRQNKTSNDSNDKKTKRPPSKSHKKKSKPAELQINGFHDHDGHRNGSPQEHPPHTKKKGHRSNQSINSQHKRSPPINSRPNTHAHPPSTAHTPPDLPIDLQVHSYSDSFLRLYDDDDDVQLSPTNSFASLSVTNSMSAWLRDPQILHCDTGISNPEDHFQQLKIPVDTLKWPELVIKTINTTISDISLSWRTLITPTALSQSGRIGELNGIVGFQKDYCEDAENQWSDMAHSRPFIFFHPRLPLCIDTRTEGSICRYVRRSCRANTSIETFIASRSAYHFWLVSERPLAANEQITLPWDFRFPANLRSRYLHQLNLGDEDGPPFDGGSINEEEYNQLSQMVHNVLSDHGGCACDLGNDCAFARFHRNYHGRSHIQSNVVKSKKGRRPKQNHVSPTSTGHATNSRAASEGEPDLCDEDDNRSVSGSSRGKPHSRDLTPNGVGESNGILTGQTEREKRKIQMTEESFKKMEQPQKRQRNSTGKSTTPQPAPKTKQRSKAPRMSISQPNGRSKQYVDASTSGRKSGSPFSAVSPTAVQTENHASRTGSVVYQSRQGSIVPKGAYTDSSTQTDDLDNSWWKQPTAKPKRTIVPLAKRLLKNRQRIQSQQLSGTSDQPESTHSTENLNVNGQRSPVVAMDLDLPVRYSTESPVEVKGRNASITSSTPSVELSVDVPMSDLPAILISNSIKPPPPPWPGNPNNVNGPYPPGPKSPDLRVQMPATPTFTTPNMSGPLSGSITPSSAAGSMAQSPFGTVHFPSTFAPAVNGIGQHPSPAKPTKKMSLSDYKAARMKKNDNSHTSNNNGGSSPTIAPAVLKPLLSMIEEAKAPGILEGSAIVDTPIAENSLDPMSSAPISTSDLAARSTLPSERMNGTL